MDINLSSSCNIFVGGNGSGKTSLLESVFLYWNGRSFRTTKLSDIVFHTTDEMVVRGVANHSNSEQRFGFHYDAKSKLRRFKLNGELVPRSSELAEALPVYYFSPQSENLISGSPGARRSLLFWYMFHVEPEFNNSYLLLQKSLKNRNQLLRNSSSNNVEFDFWESEIAKHSIALKNMTDNKLIELKDVFLKQCHEQLDASTNEHALLFERISSLGIKYSWKEDSQLLPSLKEKREYESKVGYTTLGYQKSDLVIESSYGLKNFSRGEEKSITMIIIISVLMSLFTKTKKNILVLLDDLSAELDTSFTALLLAKLSSLPLQLFITTLNKDSLVETVKNHFSNFKLFHVKQGEVIEEQNV